MSVSWQAIGVGLAVLSAWSGLLLWCLKWMLDRTTMHIDRRIDGLSASIGEFGRRADAIEKDVLALRVELARDYVRREDWIRAGTKYVVTSDALLEQVEILRKTLEASE